MFGKTKTRRHKKNTLKHSLSSDQKIVYKLQHRVEKSLSATSFFEPRPKGPLNATHTTFLCITNL